MKIELLGAPKVIMSNPESIHNYFAWPSIARLQNGKIAVVASGYRIGHICPFGKAVIAYSDEGETYTAPAPVIDTVLDDRDAGICTFGESGVVLTSFNVSAAFVRNFHKEHPYREKYVNAYLDQVSEEEERKASSTYRISRDCGVTFGKLYRSPITSPHGPLELKNGTVLWVGRTHNPNDEFLRGRDFIRAYKMDLNGGMEFVGEIESIYDEEGNQILSCEPHTVELADGRLLCQFRGQSLDNRVFTVYQSESADEGKHWTVPRRLLDARGGAPAHLLRHSSGTLVSVYGYREAPYGIRTMFSSDGSEWDTGYVLYASKLGLIPGGDIGYPASLELRDGTILTVFYAHPEENGPAVILQQRWRFE